MSKQSIRIERSLTLYIPQDVLLGWSSVEDVEAHGVDSILLHHFLRVYTVVFGLTHLLPAHLQLLPAFSLDRLRG